MGEWVHAVAEQLLPEGQQSRASACRPYALRNRWPCWGRGRWSTGSGESDGARSGDLPHECWTGRGGESHPCSAYGEHEAEAELMCNCPQPTDVEQARWRAECFGLRRRPASREGVRVGTVRAGGFAWPLLAKPEGGNLPCAGCETVCACCLGGDE